MLRREIHYTSALTVVLLRDADGELVIRLIRRGSPRT